MEQPSFEGFLHVWADETITNTLPSATQDASRREIILDYRVGGNPAYVFWTAPRDSLAYVFWTAPRDNPAYVFWTAPLLSSNGQALIYTQGELPKDYLYVLQPVDGIAEPPWGTLVGQPYRLAGPTVNISMSINIGYLSSIVPDGAERWLKLYRLDNNQQWEELPNSHLDDQKNMMTAAIPGPGIYALISTFTHLYQRGGVFSFFLRDYQPYQKYGGLVHQQKCGERYLC